MNKESRSRIWTPLLVSSALSARHTYIIVLCNKYMAAPTPAVLDLLRELVADGLSVSLCVEQLADRGHQATLRQVRRWRELHVPQVWRGTDAQLDVIVQRLMVQRELGDNEGYRWLHSLINEEVAPLRVGAGRVAKALRRCMPAQVQARLKIVQKRLVRRQHHYRYYQEVTSGDLHCKLTFGSVKILGVGFIDSDCRWFHCLEPAFVKTARAVYYAYERSLAEDGGTCGDIVRIDGGTEFNVLEYAREQQGLRTTRTRSVNNTRIERPWGDLVVKAVAPALRAFEQMERDGVYDDLDVHHRYALRAAMYTALVYGFGEFKARYNEHNVAGARGGQPSIRRKYRTRPADAPAPAVFDTARDWPAEYANDGHAAYHCEDHVVELYSLEVLRLLRGVPNVPDGEASWKDIKFNLGKGAFRRLFVAATRASQSRATAASILKLEKEEMRRRGARVVDEDPRY